MNSPQRLLLPIDEYSAATTPIDLIFRTTTLATGTGFIWKQGDTHFLVTNWHNVTGINPFTKSHISSHAGEPDTIKIYFSTPAPATDRLAVCFHLYDGDGKPNWLIHPDHGHEIDVVALPINIHTGAVAHPINFLDSLDLVVQIGMDVFILGYPLGIGVTALPVWKRASIASEPELITTQQRFVFLDTASRPGMSGSPVIRRSWGSHATTRGHQTGSPQRATRFVGIYSGRVGPSDAELQLGIMWPSRFVEDIIKRGVRDDRSLW